MTSHEEGLARLSLQRDPADVGDEADIFSSRPIDHIKAPAEQSSADEADDFTCAICLNRIPNQETAQPVGCDHVYCTCCILHWACFKEKPWCPQCKQPFQSLITFRTLDGQLHDHPCQEPIALLRCTSWFQDHVKMRERAIAAANCDARQAASSSRPQGSVIDESDYLDYARYYQEYDDDEEVEDYYFSSAAGRARVVLGNRRHGPNGYLSSGRMQARPAPQPSASKGGKGKGKGRASTGTSASTPGSAQTSQGSGPRAPASAPQASRSSGPGRKKKALPSAKLDTDDESDAGGPTKTHSAGRRARRAQRRAANDARLEI